MTRRRKSSTHPAFSLWNLYGDIFRANMQAGKLWMSAAEVISRRSVFFSDALLGKIPFTDAEFTRMWQEKMVANLHAWKALVNILEETGARCVLAPDGTWLSTETLRTNLNHYRKLSRPYEVKASANVRRLRKSSR